MAASYQQLRRPRVGLVGPGRMVGRLAMQLLDAGYPVTGYSRTRFETDRLDEARLVETGLMLAESFRAATEAAEIGFTMVSDPQTLRRVTGGADGILQKEQRVDRPPMRRWLAERRRRPGGDRGLQSWRSM